MANDGDVNKRARFDLAKDYNTINLERMIQTLQQQINEMQIQINNLSSGGSGGGDSDGMGTM